MGKGDLNRQCIIRAADDLFYRQGFDHTSFTDIAEAADIPRGNFYYYFKSKDDLLAAVIQYRHEGIRTMLQEWNEQIPAPCDRLRRYAQMLLNSQTDIEQYGCPVGSLCTELAKLRHLHQENANDMFEVFRNWLEQQFELLGYTKQAHQYALHLMARGQGISMVANAYQDRGFLQHEVSEIIHWIENL